MSRARQLSSYGLYALTFVGLIVGLPLLSLPTAAQGKAVVRASSETIGLGLTGTVLIQVRSVSDLYGADVQLSFDPQVIEVVDADPSTGGLQVQAGDFLAPGFLIRNTADNEAGTVWYAMTQLNPSQPKSGSGTLIIVTFRGKKEGGSSEIVIESATLATRWGETIPLILENGRVQVVSADQAPPTPTTAPTGKPPLTMPTATPIPQPAGPTATPIREAPTVMSTPQSPQPPAQTQSSSWMRVLALAIVVVIAALAVVMFALPRT